MKAELKAQSRADFKVAEMSEKELKMKEAVKVKNVMGSEQTGLSGEKVEDGGRVEDVPDMSDIKVRVQLKYIFSYPRPVESIDALRKLVAQDVSRHNETHATKIRGMWETSRIGIFIGDSFLHVKQEDLTAPYGQEVHAGGGGAARGGAGATGCKELRQHWERGASRGST